MANLSVLNDYHFNTFHSITSLSKSPAHFPSERNHNPIPHPIRLQGTPHHHRNRLTFHPITTLAPVNTHFPPCLTFQTIMKLIRISSHSGSISHQTSTITICLSTICFPILPFQHLQSMTPLSKHSAHFPRNKSHYSISDPIRPQRETHLRHPRYHLSFYPITTLDQVNNTFSSLSS